MKFPGLRTIQALLKINWAYLPLYYIQIFLNLLPNDEVFRSLRAFLLKLLGLQIGKNSRWGKDIFVLNYANLLTSAIKFILLAIKKFRSESVAILVTEVVLLPEVTIWKVTL